MITKFVLDDPDTLIRIGYHPGFCLDDMTSWKIQITETGELTQVIRWHTEPLWADSDNPYFRNRPKRDVRFAQLTEKQMEQLRNTIDALDLEGLRQLQEKYGNSIDDAEEVSITIPAKELDLELSVYSLEGEALRAGSAWSETERSCLRSLILLDAIVDSFAPFSSVKHNYELRVQREKDLADDERRRLNRTWLEKAQEFVFSGVWNLGVILIVFMLCLIPLTGIYELGKTVWYLSRYESELGEVVGCHRQETELSSGYAIVVQTKEGVRITGGWNGSQENCVRQLGTSIKVLINPEDRQVAVLNTFVDRWLMALVLLGLSGVIVFLAFKRRTIF